MTDEDRIKWDSRYESGQDHGDAPDPGLVELADWLPDGGRVLDLAGGDGRNAVWLAQRGLDVVVADISVVGLELARQRADRAEATIETRSVDLDGELPTGPWELVVSVLYLHRDMLRRIAADANFFTPGGTLMVVHPTRTNLSRHRRPPERFLLADGELPELVSGLEVVFHREGWTASGRHDAQLVARRPSLPGDDQ